MCMYIVRTFLDRMDQGDALVFLRLITGDLFNTGSKHNTCVQTRGKWQGLNRSKRKTYMYSYMYIYSVLDQPVLCVCTCMHMYMYMYVPDSVPVCMFCGCWQVGLQVVTSSPGLELTPPSEPLPVDVSLSTAESHICTCTHTCTCMCTYTCIKCDNRSLQKELSPLDMNPWYMYVYIILCVCQCLYIHVSMFVLDIGLHIPRLVQDSNGHISHSMHMILFLEMPITCTDNRGSS